MAPARPAPAGGIGLSLAGGGPAGAIYEIGALWALEEALEGLDLAALRCYVGVSAGALLAACLANGMSPQLLVRIIHGDAAGEEPFEPEIFFAPNYREFVRRGVSLPRLLAQALWYFTGPRGDRSVLASLSRTARALPLGLFDNEPIRRHLSRVFARPGRTDDFRQLPTTLVVVASDLETGQALRFGPPPHAHVPISRAVQASTALPGLYPPVTIDGRLCADGVLLKTVHASVALEQGVSLLFCVNPIVPVNTAVGEARGDLAPGELARGGLPAVLSQTFRTLVHSRMAVGMSSYATRYPDADVVLVEPPRDAYDMFFAHLFSLRERREVCELAYRLTRAQLRAQLPDLEPRLARHGLRVREDVLADESRTVWTGPEGIDEPKPARRSLRRQAATRRK